MADKMSVHEMNEDELSGVTGGMGGSKVVRYGEMVWVIKQNPCNCPVNEYGVQGSGNAGSSVAGQAAEGNRVVCSYCRTQIATYNDIIG